MGKKGKAAGLATFRSRLAERERIRVRLQQLAEKIKLQYHGARGVNVSVYPAPSAVDSYRVEFSKGRISRRVDVDASAVQRLMLGPADPVLVREMRTALLAVIARARAKEEA